MTNKRMFFIWLFFQGVFLTAQDHLSSTCEIQNEDVFITFHASCLRSVDPACLAVQDFKKYNLDSVVRSGKWQSWQKDGWTLSKTGEDMFRLHKKLSLFNRDFDFEDKFNIDISHWNFPVSEPLKQGSSQVMTEPVKVDFRGNVEFVLKGKSNAYKVVLSGTFNHWNEQSFRMIKEGQDWKLKFQMPPGIYEYKFIVDGEWITDPANKFKVQNQHFTYNSILIVGKDTEFFLPGYTNAKRVSLSGSFNNWDKTGVPMRKTKDGWKITQKLPPGKHYYKMIIDKHHWITDPDNTLMKKDDAGNVNSVIIVH
jgi:hypothetical protein